MNKYSSHFIIYLFNMYDGFFLYVWIPHTHLGPMEVKKGTWSPGTEIVDGCELLCGHWKPYPTSAYNCEPSLYPSNIFSFTKSKGGRKRGREGEGGQIPPMPETLCVHVFFYTLPLWSLRHLEFALAHFTGQSLNLPIKELCPFPVKDNLRGQWPLSLESQENGKMM